MRKLVFISSMLALMLILQSHEFWLEPVKYKLKVGEELIVDFKVGENFTGQPWDLGTHKVEKMTLYEKSQPTDYLDKVPKVKNGRLKILMTTPGTKLLSMISSADYIEIDAQKFNEYLQEDGLEEAIRWRTEHKQANKGGTEFYTRYTKLIVQVGDQQDDTWKKVVGHKYEIMPLKNPTTVKAGDYMDVKLLFEGRPVPHAMVKIWGHVGNKIFLQNTYTEDDGSVRFPISASGSWLISTVKMQRSKTKGAEWESSWSSLVFNVD